MKKLCLIVSLFLLLTGCGQGEQPPASGRGQVASSSQMAPVEALDKGIPCAAFSKNKEIWYDRTLVFRADSLPLEAFQDGVYPTANDLGLSGGQQQRLCIATGRFG